MNQAELLSLKGHHKILPIVPSKIGSEATGEFVAIYENMTNFEIGYSILNFVKDQNFLKEVSEYLLERINRDSSLLIHGIDKVFTFENSLEAYEYYAIE